jgi:hypothetical protein
MCSFESLLLLSPPQKMQIFGDGAWMSWGPIMLNLLTESCVFASVFVDAAVLMEAQ